MKSLRIALATIAVVAATAATLSPAQARCGRDCRHHFWVRNQLGYGGLVQTWGLGGIANAPWVGGAVVGVTPYGPYPYDHVNGL